MINLPNVTLCAVDTNPTLAIRAMNRCKEKCNFGEALLIDNFDGALNYSEFCVKKMANHIKTPFVLIVQYDGYVLNEEGWDDRFLQYDYIGAIWPWHLDGLNVGNGGFSLRSKKLLNILAEHFDSPWEFPEDAYICRKLRPTLESKFGIKFAPEWLAQAFSYERQMMPLKTFGFHGLYNMWRHTSEDEMIELTALFPDYIVLKYEYSELLIAYCGAKKTGPMKALYGRIRGLKTYNQVRQLFEGFWGKSDILNNCLADCEKLLDK